MRHRLHFISGLPRSGSTLLAAILRQNPNFHAGMTTPLAAIYSAMQAAVSRRTEGAMFLSEQQKRELLAGVFRSFYSDVGENRVVFDTNRMWCAKMPHLGSHFPEAKVICCVRHIPWIMDSIERLERRNIYELSGIFGYDAGGTVYTRINRLAASDGMVGYALDAVREAFYGGHAERLIVVTYEALTRDPEGTMRLIYDFIGEPWHEHDFDHVEYSADEFDASLGAPGLHTVRPRVEFVQRPTILPPELFARFANDAFWMNPDLDVAGAPIIRFVPAEAPPPSPALVADLP